MLFLVVDYFLCEWSYKWRLWEEDWWWRFWSVKVSATDERDAQRRSIPDHQRWAHAGRQPALEFGVIRDNMDGARVQQAHHGFPEQELHRHGWVPDHHWAAGNYNTLQINSFSWPLNLGLQLSPSRIVVSKLLHILIMNRSLGISQRGPTCSEKRALIGIQWYHLCWTRNEIDIIFFNQQEAIVRKQGLPFRTTRNYYNLWGSL